MHAAVAILSGGHLCHNPRVMKEAAALAAAGYQVEVIGGWSDSELKRRDQALLPSIAFIFSPAVDLTVAPLSRFISRLRSKAARFAYRLFGLESDWQLNPNVAALKKAANESSASLFIAHSEAGMVVAADLLKNKRRVGVDMEDWFSEDLLPEARKTRPLRLLRTLEANVLRNAAHKTCTSTAMAQALVTEYECEDPAVIYNAFPWSDREEIDGATKDRRDLQVPSIHWYSQTLGFGRGLEELIAALPLLKCGAEIHLRGKPEKGFSTWLEENLPREWSERVFIHQLVPTGELLSRIAEHDIGFAGEQTYARSRDLTVTNKIMHYLLAGLAVVASDTTGQREVAARASGAVLLYRAGDSSDLAAKLDSLLSAASELVRAKMAALKTAEEIFCWEKQIPILVNSVTRAFQA